MGEELLKEQQRQTAELLAEVASIVMSTDPRDPGNSLRIDRLERQVAQGVRVIKWVCSTGLSLLGIGVALLWKVLHTMEEIGGL